MTESNKTEQPPRLPEVGEYVRMKGRLVEVQDVTPRPPPKEVDYIFEDTNSRVESRINGKTVETYGAFNNFYGQDTCVESAIEDAQKIQRHFGPSDMEFVVVKTTFRRRMRPRRDRDCNLHDKTFLDFEPPYFGSCRELPEDIEEVVWSSKAAEKVT